MITISIDPIAFHIGPMEIRWYGIIAAVGVAAVILWMTRQITSKKAELPKTPDPIVIVLAILSGVVASKLFHVVDMKVATGQWGEFFSGAGLSIYGAIVGVSLFFLIYSRVRHTQFGFFADLVAPGIILAQAIGRVGCTINGCCYGMPTSLPWGVVYTHPDSIAYFASQALPPGMGLHPTQVYEIMFCLIGFAVLLRLRGRFKPDGSLFLVYLTLYSAWRVGIDFWRAGTSFLFGLHQAQIIAIVVLAVTIPLLALRTRRVKPASQTEATKVGTVHGEEQ
jgi:phosphatidylglycerol:prolipoprotein diacylglycerol transferase